MNNNIIKKTFLNANDICIILSCGKNKAYEFIDTFNKEMEKNGFTTFKGKVLASALYEKLNMTDLQKLHKLAWERGDIYVKNNKNSEDKEN